MRLPTRDLLIIQSIIPLDAISNCVLCSSVCEWMEHSFLMCRVVRLIWRETRECIGFEDHSLDNPGYFKDSFLRWFLFCKSMKVLLGKHE